MKNILQYVILFVALFSLAACATSQLDKLKKQHKNGSYEIVVKAKVDCNASDGICNQKYLIKGDACYRLAKREASPLKNYDCAIAELGMGISLTKDWKIGNLNLNRNQVYENLSESLRERQDMSKGGEATKFANKLLEVSKQFLGFSPENLAAIYYNNSARFTTLRSAILMTPGDSRVCKAVNHILSQLQSVRGRAMDSKYAAMYSRLILDVGGVKPALEHCQ